VAPAPWLAPADTLDVPALQASAAPLARLSPQGEPMDERRHNSWRRALHEVSPGELASAHTVNALAPYVLLSSLRGALAAAAARAGGAFVVNVTAIEGQFSQRRKPSRHPHTNMAKAALNMLTRTVSEELSRERIFVTSVDPGWVSEQNPFAAREAMAAMGFAPPLDDEDGAARVLDPVLRARRGEAPLYGVLLKDYSVSDW
jgi:NAD(P)-dependent dehydrogenase (short-subunit alcohol dehydrogenase family)